MKVFVYGTLKSNYGNNHIIEDKRYIGDFTIADYKLMQHHGGGIPFAIPFEGQKIKGEVWDIEDDEVCLQRLDWLEGHPDFYRRTPAQTVDGQDVQLYVLSGHDREREFLQDCPKNAHNEYFWER